MSTEFSTSIGTPEPDAPDDGRRMEILAAFLLGLADQ